MSDDAAKKQCEILDEAQRRIGHQVSQWREAGQSVLNEAFPRAVPPAMQRASSEAQFNVVGDELRKLGDQMSRIERTFEPVMTADEGRAELQSAKDKTDKILASLQLIMQKLEVLDFGIETLGLQQDVIEKKLDEQFVPSETFDEWWQCVGHTHMPKKDEPPEHGAIAERAWNAALRSVAARKRQPKPVRRKKGKR